MRVAVIAAAAVLSNKLRNIYRTRVQLITASMCGARDINAYLTSYFASALLLIPRLATHDRPGWRDVERAISDLIL